MRTTLSNKRRAELSTLLQSLFHRYNDRKFLGEDPVCFVHRYSDPRDQEVVGLISALLSFGNVKAIQGSVGKVLKALGPHPYLSLIDLEPERLRESLGDGGHRWVRAVQVTDILRSFDPQDPAKFDFPICHFGMEVGW